MRITPLLVSEPAAALFAYPAGDDHIEAFAGELASRRAGEVLGFGCKPDEERIALHRLDRGEDIGCGFELDRRACPPS